ncbi:MAG: hypothetical protein ACO1TE_12315 [Prosthecobacter sp.]
MSEAKIKAPRRSAIDTLVLRDRTAVFWFLAACAVAAACAWYVTLMSDVMKQRPPFVVMDTSGAYYVPPGYPYSEMDAMHLHLADVFTETLLERTPEGLVYEDRLSKLCLEDAFLQIRTDLQKEERFFTTQKAVQTARIETREIVQRLLSTVATQTTGTVHRRSFFNGKEQSETYSFTLIVVWRQNGGIVANMAFPSRVERVHRMKLEKISDS